MSFTRNRGSKRLRLRGRGGRFKRATIANTFGLKVLVCPLCRRCNPIDVGAELPEQCHGCNQPIKSEDWE